MLLKVPISIGGPNPLWCCLLETVSGSADGLYPCYSMSHSGVSSSTSIAIWLLRLTSLNSIKGLTLGWGGGNWDGPASGWGKDQGGWTTCVGGADGLAVATVGGSSIEASALIGRWLLRSLSSHSRSWTWLHSLVSAASAVFVDFFVSQSQSFISLICACRSLICPCMCSSASILMLLMNLGQVLWTVFSISEHSRLIWPRLWALSRWLMYSWQQAHPLAWWMAMWSVHPLIFQAALWCAAIKASVSKDTIAEVCPNTGVGMTEFASSWTCGVFWDLSIFYERRWRWWQLLRST